MNRAQRRAAARRKSKPVVHGPVLIGNPSLIAQLSPQCPDCNSELDHWTDQAGMHHIDIMHDDTCPTWQGMQRR